MATSDVAQITEQLRARLADFHEAVRLAQRRALQRTLQQALRQLVWLNEIAHSTAQDAWHVKLTEMQEYLAGLPRAAASLQGEVLTLPSLAEQARKLWREGFGEAVADALSRLGEGPEDLEALGRALALFCEELARAVTASPAGGEDQ